MFMDTVLATTPRPILLVFPGGSERARGWPEATELSWLLSKVVPLFIVGLLESNFFLEKKKLTAS